MRFVAFQIDDSEGAVEKNRIIKTCSDEFFTFYNENETSEKGIKEIIEENLFLLEYDAIVFGNNVYEGVNLLKDWLLHYDTIIYAFIVRKEMFGKVGLFNEKLAYGNFYELIARIVRKFHVFCINCAGNDCYDNVCKYDYLSTFAYITTKYWDVIKENSFENLLFRTIVANETTEMWNYYKTELQLFLQKRDRFDEIECSEWPILFLNTGKKVAYGILYYFAKWFAEGLREIGQPCVMAAENTDITIENVLTSKWKAIVGFEALNFNEKWMNMVPCPKFQFWVDNPMFSEKRIFDTECHLLVLDKDYEKYVNLCKYNQEAFFLPPGGVHQELLEDEKKEYDVSFIGTSYQYDSDSWNKDEKAFFQFIIENSSMNFVQAAESFYHINSVENHEFMLMKLTEMKQVCEAVPGFFRQKIIEKLIQDGITIHVFGSSWKNYELQYPNNIIVHENIDAEAALEIYRKSKICLNFMTWHKDGMTERIANTLLAGAVCVTEESRYIREHFIDNEEMIIFSLSEKDELSKRIGILLENEDERKRIAENGYAKACKEHTWKERAEEFLEIIKIETDSDLTLDSNLNDKEKMFYVSS